MSYIVLILVLMEDALAHILPQENYIRVSFVLILVLMEDALAPATISTIGFIIASLNPCFKGRCTSTLIIYLFLTLRLS